MKIVAGIDVSKGSLDVSLGAKSRQFANTAEGHRSLLSWSKKAELFVMEATGSYHLDLAQFLSGQSKVVSVVNPAQASHYAKAIGKRNKTDRVDAAILAEFGSRFEVPIYVPLSESQMRMRQLARFRSELVDKAAAIKTGVQDPIFGELETQMMEAQLKLLKEQAKEVERLLSALIKEDEGLKRRHEALTSIPGVGPVASWTLQSEIIDPNRFETAKQVAAYAGICPKLRLSGTSLKGTGTLSRQGNSRIRRILYLAALAAIRGDNTFRDFYIRLVSKGKPKMTALVAVMHKMLRVALAVMKSEKPFISERLLTAA